jgi:hypothetical protein
LPISPSTLLFVGAAIVVDVPAKPKPAASTSAIMIERIKTSFGLRMREANCLKPHPNAMSPSAVLMPAKLVREAVLNGNSRGMCIHAGLSPTSTAVRGGAAFRSGEGLVGVR